MTPARPGKAHLHRDYKSCSKWYSEKEVIDCEKVFEIGFAKDGDFDFKLSASSEDNLGDLIIKPDSFSYGTGQTNSSILIFQNITFLII